MTTGGPSAHTPYAKQLERMERLAGCGLQLAMALRSEFRLLWEQPTFKNGIPEAAVFVSRVEKLGALGQRFQKDVQRCRTMAPVQGLGLLRMMDPALLLEAGQGLEVTARELRVRAREVAQGGGGPVPLPWTGPDGWNRLFVETLGQGPLIGSGAGASEARARAQAGRGLGIVDRQNAAENPVEKRESRLLGAMPKHHHLKQFESTLALFEEVVQDTGVRLAVVRIALDKGGFLPKPAGSIGPAPALAQTKPPPDMVSRVPAIAEALATRPPTRHSALLSLDQWDRASRLLAEYVKARDAAREAAREADGDAVAEILRPFPVHQLKGLLIPLSSLHFTFRGVSPLASLFPPPTARRVESGPLGAPAAVAPPGAAAPTGAATPPGVATRPEAAAPPRPPIIAPEPVPAGPPPKALSPAEERSQDRQAQIRAYTEGQSISQDIRGVVEDEHEFQNDRVMDLGMRLRFFPKETEDEAPEKNAERTTMESELATARARESSLRELMARLKAEDK